MTAAAAFTGRIIGGRVKVAVTLLASFVALAAFCSDAWGSAVTNFSITPAPATAGAKRVVDTYSFKAKSAIPASSGFVQLRAPSGGTSTFESNEGDYTVTVGSSTQYAAGATVNPEGLGANVVDIYLNSAVAAGETVTVAAYAVSNPTSSGSYEYGVSTSSDTGLAKKTTTIAASSSVTGLAVTASTHAANAHGVKYTATFKVANGLTSGKSTAGSASEPGYFVLTAPTGAEFADGYIHVVDGSQSEWTYLSRDPEGAGNNVAQAEVPSTLTIAAGDTVQLTAPTVHNPPSPLPGGQFAVATSSDVTPAKVSVPITAATAITGVTASATPTAAGATEALYQVGFTATTAFADNTEEGYGCGYYYYYYDECGYIRLQAPKGTVFPTDNADYEVSFGAVNTTPWFVIVKPEEADAENVVDIQLPYGTEVPAGAAVHVNAYGVKNPSTANAAGEIEVSTAVDTVAVKKPLAISAQTAPTSVTVSSSNKEAGASGVHLAVALKVTSAIPVSPNEETSYVRLEAPAGSRLGYYYRVSNGAEAQVAYGYPDPEGEGSNVARVRLPFAVAAGETIEIRTGDVTNAPEPAAGAEFGVSTSSDATIVKSAFPLIAQTSVKNVSVSAHPASAGAARSVEELAFTTTNAMPSEEAEETYYDCYYSYYEYGSCRHIRLEAPEGTTFSTNYYDYVLSGADGAHRARYVAVDPEGTEHRNVIDLYLEPSEVIAAGEKLKITVLGVKNPSAAGAGDEFALATSADPKAVARACRSRPPPRSRA